MKHRTVLSLALLIVLTAAAIAQDSGKALLREDYGALLPESTPQVALWTASSGWKVHRERSTPTTPTEAIEVALASNEYEATQLILCPQNALEALQVQPGDLTGPGGAVIAAAEIEVLKVRYVHITRGTDKESLAGWWPDPLPPIKEALNLEAGKQQPFWLRVHVPKGTPPGLYTGRVHLKAHDYEAFPVLKVQVFDFALPDQMTCTTAFGLHPGNIARYHGLKTEEQRRIVWDKYLDNFSKHHISPYSPSLSKFNVTWRTLKEGEGAELPEADRKLMQEHPLIPEFDWAAWDKEMEKGIEQYHFNTFRCSIPGLGGGTFYGRSGPSLQGFPEDSREYHLALSAYCQKFEAHLREKGWLEEAFLYWFDEPAPRDYEFVKNGFLKAKKYAPDLNRMITERVTPEMFGGPNIWCPTPLKLRPEVAAERIALGEKMWWYLCTVPKSPFVGLFTDRAATDLRLWSWQSWQYDISGILVWASNLWTTSCAYPTTRQNPYEDPMSWMSGYGTKKGEKRPWGNGDGRFIYPPEAAADGTQEEAVLDGPVDSIRWEMLRDGLEDYEYFVILKTLIDEKSHRLDPRLQRKCRRLLKTPASVSKGLRDFTIEPGPIERHRLRLAETIALLRAQ